MYCACGLTLVLITLFSTLNNSKVTAMLSLPNSSDTIYLSQCKTLEGLKLYKHDKNRVLCGYKGKNRKSLYISVSLESPAILGASTCVYMNNV